MNILIINYEYPPLGGGAGRQCQLLSEELSKKHKVFVLTSHYNSLSQTERPNPGLAIIRLPVFRKYLFKVRTIELVLFIIKGILKSISIVRSNDINIVISFFAVPSGIIALFLKKLFHISYIISLRGFDVPGHLTKEYKYYQKYSFTIIKKVLASADKIVAVSAYLANLAKHTFPNLNIDIIPNAVRQVSKKAGHKKISSKVKILTVGRLNPLKKLDSLINSIKLIKSKKDFELVIVGDGPERKKLENEVKKLSLEKKVKFIGWIKREKIEKLYQESDIFVLPSIEEAMSNVLLEAISFGHPIVAINIPSSREIVKDNLNGFLIPQNHITKMAEKISKLINDPVLRKNFGLISLKIAKKYSIEKMVKSYEILIDKINSNKLPDFKFGENWLNFSKKFLSKEKIIEAKKSLIDIFGSNNIKGKSFIDVGCGSGLFSLAAYNLKASKIVSFDIDPQSVNCCKSMFIKEKKPSNWKIKEGSILAKKFIRSLGKFDIVYSYGVLHHTGRMKEAIKNTAKLVAPGGLLYLAIYNKKENFTIFPIESFGTSKFWEYEKRIYNKIPSFGQKFAKNLIKLLFTIARKTNKKERGMSLETDITDWLGGYPYEYASAEEIINFVKKLGFSLEKLKNNTGLRNNEYLFKKLPDPFI